VPSSFSAPTSFATPTTSFAPPTSYETAPNIPMPNGKVFTVFSPKGGVGKSMLAVNLAVALARAKPESVALLDLSLTFGHDMLLLNLQPKSSLAATTAAAVRQMNLNEGLAYYLTVHPSSSLRVLTGSTKPEDGEGVSGELAKVAIEQLRRYFEYVVVDTGSHFTDPVISALEAADRVLLLCSPEIAVVRDVRDTERILNDVVHITRDKIVCVMNYLFPFKTLSKQQFESSLEQQIQVELPYGGEAPAKAALRGEALMQAHSGSPIAKSIDRLASQLVAETSKTVAGVLQEKRRGFFR
jgi:pilus assembly protein CpaE